MVKSGVLVGNDKSEVEGSMVREESKENRVLELGSVERVTDGEVSVVDESGSSEVGVGVSNVPVLDGNTSVTVGSSVSVSVCSELTSNGTEGEGVDVGKSVGVSGGNVGVGGRRDLVKNGGIEPVKVKGGNVKRTVSPSSLMGGFDKAQ